MRWSLTAALTVAMIASQIPVRGISPIFPQLADVAPVAVEAHHGDSVTWTSTTSLPEARYAAGLVHLGGFVFLIGGASFTVSETSGSVGDSVATVYRAAIGDDGTLGPWLAVSSLNTPRMQPAVVSSGSEIWVFGGYTGGNHLPDGPADWEAVDSIERAGVSPDGSLSAWQTVATTLSSPRAGMGTFVAENVFDRVYLIGGETGFGTGEFHLGIATTESITFSALRGESAGIWRGEAPLPAARRGHATTGVRDRVLVTGGIAESGSLTNTIYRGTVNFGGETPDLLSWTTLPSTMPDGGVAYHAQAALNGFLYTSGGTGSVTSEGGHLKRIAVNNDQTLEGSWQNSAQGTFSTNADSQMVGLDGFLYYVPHNFQHRDVLRVRLHETSPTSETGWTALLPNLTPRFGHAAAVAQGRLHVLGGKNRREWLTLDSVETISPAGVVTEGTSMMRPRQVFKVATHEGDALLAVGGNNQGTILSSVEGTVVEEDGSFVDWSELTPMPEPRHAMGVAVIGDELYVFGGVSTSGPLDSIIKAPITRPTLNTIELGSWSEVGTIPAAQVFVQTAYVGGHLFIRMQGEGDVAAGIYRWGGESSWTAVSSPPFIVQGFAGFGSTLIAFGGSSRQAAHTTVSEMGSLGTWTDLPDTVFDRTFAEAAVLGEHLWLTGGIGSYHATGQNSVLSSVERMVAPVDTSGEISGIARCSEEGSLPFATVQLIQAGTVLDETTANADGFFSFSGVGSGTFTLKFIVDDPDGDRVCTVPVTVDGDGEATFGEAEVCQPSNTWPTAVPITANGIDVRGVICDGGRRWYKIVMPSGSTPEIVPPLSRIVARLTGVDDGRLPGDFTLMLVKDPRLALQPVADAEDAHVQFAGDTFGGDTFGGDTFGGDTFGGDTFGGDTFGGDTFGGDTFGGDTFGGDTFGGDTFGGDTFGGDTFGGDTFGAEPELAGRDPQAYAAAVSRSVVRVAAHPGTSPEGLWQNTWANTITWYLRVSSYRGSLGAFKLDTEVFTGACASINPSLGVSSRVVPPTGSFETLILRHSGREGAGANPATNGSALQAFATSPSVNGFVVDFAGDMTGAYSQYDNNALCPAAANLVADGIRGYIREFRKVHPELKWILIAASDEGVPLYRIPDYSSLAPQSMLPLELRPAGVLGEIRLNFYGTDDAYGDFDPVQKADHFLFLPELGVGRISEPRYVPSMVQAFLGNPGTAADDGLLTPQTAAVYGYNFWNDSANSIKDQLQLTGKGVNQFTTAHPPIQSGQGLPTDADAWNAQDLLDGVAANTDILVLMAHGLRASQIAPANYNPTVTPEQLINMGNTNPAIKRLKLLISGACNFALNVPGAQAIPNVTPDPETAEISQALGWTAVAWDAYAYGDDERIAYSEELADDLVRELRYGTGPVVLGGALARVKNAWAARQTDLFGIQEKSLMSMVIVGFPMLRVDLGTQGRLTRPSDLADFTSAALAPVAAGTPGSNPELHLRTKDITVDFDNGQGPELARTNVTLATIGGGPNTIASYYAVTTPDNPLGFVQMNPLEPIGPRWSVPLHPSDLAANDPTFARGAVLMSASCEVDESFIPLVSVPAYQLTAPRGPYVTDRFLPNAWWEINYLESGREFLLIRPAQYRSAISPSGRPEIFGTERRFEQVAFRAYYSSLLLQTVKDAAGHEMQAILAGPPEFLSHSAEPSGNTIDFDVVVSGLPHLGIQDVIVTWWNAAPGADCDLNSLALTPEPPPNGGTWRGQLTLPTGVDPANVRYLLQAVNGAGRVRVADNFGLGFVATVPPTVPEPLVDTDLAFEAPTPTATFSGREITVAAKLTRMDTGANLAGEKVTFRLGGVGADQAFAYTDANGLATAELEVDALPGALFIHASFEGSDGFNYTSERSAGIVVSKETTSFVSTSVQPANAQQGAIVNVSARLIDGLSRRLREQGVLFLITGPGCTQYDADATACNVLQAQGAETDFRGDARAAIILDVAVGSYRIHAAFASDDDDEIRVPSGSGGTLTLDLKNARYDPSRANLGEVTVTTQKIAFTSSRTGNGDIYVMNVDGSGVARLTDSSAIDADPDWSPDRTKIAFTSSRTGRGDVYVMNSDGSGVTRLTTSDGVDTLGSWSPDGTKIAFTSTRDGNAEIYIMNANGTGQTRLTNNPRVDADPYWSSDGTKIAFTSTRDGNAEIYVMNADGTGQKRLTNNSATDTLGSWSPDGSKIVFTSGRTGNGDIYTMNPDGTGVTRLTTSSGIDATPDWSPDGTRIVFASNRDGNSEIYVMNANGESQVRRTNDRAIDTLPSW